MGGKPTLTRKGYAVRDAEVKISKRGTAGRGGPRAIS